MSAPEGRFNVGGCDVHILGTIAGFLPDGERVEEALLGNPEAVGLGIPPEDLENLGLLASAADPITLIDRSAPLPEALDEPAGAPGVEGIHAIRQHASERAARAQAMESELPFIDLDDTQKRLLDLLGGFGPTRIPSPDLQLAYQWAIEQGRPIEALDMDDETHSAVYVKQVGLRHAWKSGRVLNKLLKKTFHAEDAYDLMDQWDAFANQQRQLQAVEAAREVHFAKRIVRMAKGRTRIVVVVPSPRFPGLVDVLQSGD